MVLDRVRLFFVEEFFCPIHGPFCPRMRLSSAHFGGTATKPARTRVFPAASRASKRCRTPSVCPPQARSLLDIHAAFWYGAVGREAGLRWL